jgi:transcriptional regulator with XRE-family HTH domain
MAPKMRKLNTASGKQAATGGIGQRLRQRRRIRRISLVELSKQTGLSIGLLSQIERDISAPSLRSLRLICDVLEVQIGWLFDQPEPTESEFVVRTAQRRRIALSKQGILKELLSPDAVPRIQMMRMVLHPGTATDTEEYTLPAAECGTVISGRLGFQIMGHTSILEAGDSFAFDEAASHRFWCEGDVPVEILMVTTPAIY